MTNFIDDVIDGKTKLDEIDDYVENGIIQIHIVVCPNILE